MFITVVGGGNSTAIFAALAKTAGHDVAILTRRPEAWSTQLGFVNEDAGYLDGEESLEAEVDIITADPAACIPQSDMIFIAGLPIHHNATVLAAIKPHMDMAKKVFVGTICAYGGFDWVAAKTLGAGAYVSFGTQLIPWCCGTKVYGKQGVVFGAKRLLRVATSSGNDEDGVKDVLKVRARACGCAGRGGCVGGVCGGGLAARVGARSCVEGVVLTIRGCHSEEGEDCGKAQSACLCDGCTR